MPTGTDVRVAVLGPLLVDGQWAIESAEQRGVFAVLALVPGKPVSYDTLIDALGGGSQRVVQGCVQRLQRVLARLGGPEIVNLRGYGYQLDLAREKVDLFLFEDLTKEAAELARASQWTRVRETVGQALGLCRSTPFSGIRSQALEFDEWLSGHKNMYLRALRYRIRADIHLTRYEEAITTLDRVTVEEPTEEIFWALLMLAHYRAGSRPAAKKTYLTARTVLARELDVDPGALIEGVWSRIKAKDPPLDIPVP